MKKVVVSLTVAMFFLMMPFVSFAKQALSEKELNSTTAQEGVTIQFGKNTYGGDYFFDTNLYIRGKFLPTLQSWGDGDGCTTCGGYTAAGWIGTKDVAMDPFVSLGGPITAAPPTGSFVSFYRTMTIDVGTSGAQTKAFVGLPSVMVHPAGISQTFSAGTTQDLSSGPSFGTSYMSEFALIANSLGTGYLAISNHSNGQEGVEIEFSSTAATPFGNGVLFSIPGKPIVNSWSDTDGEQTGTGYTSAGYFGAKNMTLSDGTTYGWITNSALFHIFVTGKLTIDVGTDTSGTTAVVIGLPTIYLPASNAITQPLGFGTNRDLSADWQSLGTSYMGGLQLSPSGSLTVSAH
jgi:hypothetical protein